MVIGSERLNPGQQRLFGRFSVLVLPMRFLQSFYAVANKKRLQSRVPPLKKWEQEKIIKFGLSPAGFHLKTTQARLVETNTWKKEKIASLGLCNPCVHKNLPRDERYFIEEIEVETNETQRLEDYENAHSENQPPNSFSQQAVKDDFFRLLGYE